MVSTVQIRKNINIAESVYNDLNNKINNLFSTIQGLKTGKVKSQEIWDKMKDSSGRYIDPYNKSDRTAEYMNEMKSIENEITQKELEHGNLQRELTAKDAEVRALKLKLIRARQDNVNERKNNLNKLKQKVKRISKEALEGLKSTPQAMLNGFNDLRAFMNETKAISELKLSAKDQLFNRDLVNHAKQVKLGNKQLLGENDSKLKPEVLRSQEGVPVEHYDHYDKYTHTADIDLKTPYKYGTFEKDGVHMHTVKNVTVFLGKNGQPDFSNPKNAGVLRDPKLLNSVLEQYPKAIESIPASHIVNLSKDARQDLASAYEKGIEERRVSGDWGYNENGDALTEQEFLEEATERFNNKSKEASALKKAREEAQGYEFEQ